MINKDKISRVLVYNSAEKLLVATKSVSFPKDFFKIKGQDLVMLKGSDFPLLSKGEPIEIIFEYVNGNRVKYKTTIDLCTEYQINFHVGDGVILEERRKSFKIGVDLKGFAAFVIRDDNMLNFDSPVVLQFINLNVGGVYFSSKTQFEIGDHIMVSFLDGDFQLLTEVLRIQRKEDGTIDGYGCRFVDINKSQEEKLARFIIECQLQERERKIANGSMF